MGYTGTIVVGWSAGLLVHADGMAGFGHQHQYLRPLGDGWQLVETGGSPEGPDLPGGCRRLAAATGRPVLAAFVSDSDFAMMCTATGDRTTPVTQLHDDKEPWRPGPTGRPDEDVVGELLAWSAAAGLPADPVAVRAVLAADQLADDTVFALVRALGVARIGRTVPRAFPVDGWPFSPISTMAYFARMRAIGEAMYDDPEPLEPWETAAIALDAELWAAAYRPPVDVGSLGRRSLDVFAARNLAKGRPADRSEDRELLASLLAKGRLGPEPAIADEHGRQWADRRAT